MNEIIEEWKRKRDIIVPQMRISFENETKNKKSFKGLTFESYCQMMAFRYMQLLVKDPALVDFDLMEEYL